MNLLFKENQNSFFKNQPSLIYLTEYGIMYINSISLLIGGVFSSSSHYILLSFAQNSSNFSVYSESSKPSVIYNRFLR